MSRTHFKQSMGESVDSLNFYNCSEPIKPKSKLRTKTGLAEEGDITIRGVITRIFIFRTNQDTRLMNFIRRSPVRRTYNTESYQTGVGWRLRRLGKLVLRTITSIVAFPATLQTSTRLVPLSLTRQNLLSLRLLPLLSRWTVLSRRCLASLLRPTGRQSTWEVVGHPLDNLHLLSLWLTRRSSDHPLALPLSLRVTLKSFHGNCSIHHSTKSLVVHYV